MVNFISVSMRCRVCRETSDQRNNTQRGVGLSQHGREKLNRQKREKKVMQDLIIGFDCIGQRYVRCIKQPGESRKTSVKQGKQRDGFM